MRTQSGRVIRAPVKYSPEEIPVDDYSDESSPDLSESESEGSLVDFIDDDDA